MQLDDEARMNIRSLSEYFDRSSRPMLCCAIVDVFLIRLDNITIIYVELYRLATSLWEKSIAHCTA